VADIFDLDFGPFRGFEVLAILVTYVAVIVLVDAVRGFPEPEPSRPRRRLNDGDPAQVNAKLRSATLEAQGYTDPGDALSAAPDLPGWHGSNAR
jgi:hypothetical protein